MWYLLMVITYLLRNVYDTYTSIELDFENNYVLFEYEYYNMNITVDCSV